MDLTPQQLAESEWLQEQAELDARAIRTIPPIPTAPNIQLLREDLGPEMIGKEPIPALVGFLVGTIFGALLAMVLYLLGPFF